ncbi:MAG: serine/threonine protein kinase [Planctomycetes bacterium]|nr:serine/threonine protein kinase [Planctomycetota bacterium]
MKICLSCEGVTDTQAQRCGNCGAFLLSTDAVHYPIRRGEIDAGNPLLGSVVDGKYRLQSVLGRGGLGTVFRAQHIGSLVTVALKLLHPRFAERPEYRRALLPEARRAATVVHERCARLLDVGEGEGGITYLAMELVEGQTLDEILQRGAMAPSHAVDVLVQVAEALAAVHDAGLVHCDLSPRNVMVAARAGRLEVKVLDFGIARSVSMARRGVDLLTGDLVGFANPAFSAPELLRGDDVDPRADLYSLGTLAWLMLTGAMPVDDRDAQHASAAVREGRLLPWPGAQGVPRRLRALVLQCLQRDPDRRPASAIEVRRRLALLRAGGGRTVARVGAALAVAAVVATAATLEVDRPLFLRAVPGSSIELVERPLAAQAVAVDRAPQRLDRLVCHFGGFDPTRLSVEIVRAGEVLSHAELRPEVDATAGTLLLSSAQPAWREVVQGVLRSSSEGPVDLVFVVPGRGALSAARLRLDAQKPQLTVRLEGEGGGEALTAVSRVFVGAEDDQGIAAVRAVFEWERGGRVELSLPAAPGVFGIGAALAEQTGEVASFGAGTLRVEARDLAGNLAVHEPLRFATIDVAAPRPVSISGPGGEPFLARLGDRLRLRLQLSAGEHGCVLRGRVGVGSATVEVPLADTAVGPGPVWQSIELPIVGPMSTDTAGAVPLWLQVADQSGNTSEREFAATVRDQSLLLEVAPEGLDAAGRAAWLGDELVVSPLGATVRVTVGPSFVVVGARLELRAAPVERPSVRFEPVGDDGGRLVFDALPAGSGALVLQLRDVASASAIPVERRVPVRVLPAAIELRLPESGARWLPALVRAGVLTRRDRSVGEGPQWRLPGELRRYVEGTVWVGSTAPLPLLVPAIVEAPLLPDVQLVPGRNVLAIALVDVLGRPVRCLDGDGRPRPRVDDRVVVADFWWHDGTAELIGEQVAVEFGQPATVRLRLPLPFASGDRGELRLGVLQDELPAVSVAAADAAGGDAAVVQFEVPFAVWSVAAKFAGQPREAYARGLESEVPVYLATPAGRFDLVLRMRTVRSTLLPLQLGELAALPAPLAALRLLPLLSPAGAFAEPEPTAAPPRETYRTLQPVAVRNLQDILLQDRELTWGQARALAAVAEGLTAPTMRRRVVHHDDPLGERRLEVAALLPDMPGVADEVVLSGVDFFQAFALCRLLGVAVAGEPALFRLPFGCELELAAFGDLAAPAACHGARARGGQVDTEQFLGPFGSGSGPARWTAARCESAGDVIATPYGAPFLGIDFSVREWVMDLPDVPGAELLLRDWLGDHSVHLRRALELAEGRVDAAAGSVDGLRRFGVVRGLAYGEYAGLVDRSGDRLLADRYTTLPESVPGVLRCEQLRRDGGDLLGRGRDRRLLLVGMRVAVDAADLASRGGGR